MMINLIENLNGLVEYVPLIQAILIGIIFLVILQSIIRFTKGHLMKKVKNKRQRSNIDLFFRIVKSIIILIVFFVIFSSYFQSWTGLGVFAGLFSAALGWALQRPITGIAAWIMVITKRPFQIGDRIMIEKTKGDVVDINLMYIELSEIGGTIASEDPSGRTILIPNSILFEQKIVNYTLKDEYILDEVVTLVTYESNIKKAKKICLNAGMKFLDSKLKDKEILPYIRLIQQPSGIRIRVCYKVLASKRIETASDITDAIITRIFKEKDVNIAYPHRHIIK